MTTTRAPRTVRSADPLPVRTARCSCGKPVAAGGECAACRRARLHGSATRSGTPLEPALRGDLEQRLSQALPAARPASAAGGRSLDGLAVSPRTDVREREADRVARGTAGRPSVPVSPVDLRAVRVHTGADAARTAHAFGARAYTVGEDVVFGAGQFRPHAAAGRALLTHELVHVVQQRGSDRVIQRQALAEPELVGEPPGEVAQAPPPPPPLPSTRERLAREHPDVNRALDALLTVYDELLTGAEAAMRSSNLLVAGEGALMASYSVPRVRTYGMEIASKQQFDPKHLSTFLQYLETALRDLGRLLAHLATGTGWSAAKARALGRTHERTLAKARELGATPFMQQGREQRKAEERAAATQARVEGGVAYIKGYLARVYDPTKSPEATRIHGAVVAGTLVDKHKLSGDEIRDVFDALKAEDPQLLEAALFGGGTVAALLYRGIPGFQAYRARGEGLLAGFSRGSQESLLVNQPGQRNFDPGQKAIAVLGFIAGVFQGIGDALINNVKSLLDLFTPSFWSQLKSFMTEQLPDLVKNEEVRFGIGMMMGQMNADEERRLAVAEPEEYGRTVGHVFGSALVEIVLSFIGLGFVLKAVQASPRLMRLLGPLLKLAQAVGRTAVVQKIVRLAQVVAEAIGALSRKARGLLNRIPALTSGGRARKALRAAELAVEEAQAQVRVAERLAREALAAQKLDAAGRHLQDLESATAKLQRNLDLLERQGAGVFDEVAAAGGRVDAPGRAPDLPERRAGGVPDEVADIERRLARHRRAHDGHELYITPEGDIVRCSDVCDFIMRDPVYNEMVNASDVYARKVNAIRAKARKAAKTADPDLADEAQRDAAELYKKLEIERTIREVKAGSRRAPHEVLEGPGYTVDPRGRGFATEDLTVDELSWAEGASGTPPWFPRIDAVIGGQRRVRYIAGQHVIELTGAVGISMKSTWVTKPTEVLKKLDGDLNHLLNLSTYANRQLRVRKLAGLRLNLVFEQGFGSAIDESRQLQRALAEFAKHAKGRGVDFTWDVIDAAGNRVSGPAWLARLRK